MVRTSADYMGPEGGSSPSGAPLSLVTVQAGRAKIVLAVIKSQATIRVKIRQMTPDLTEVGGSLEEAKALRLEHDDLIIQLNMKQREVGVQLTQQAGAGGNGTSPEKVLEQLNEAWKDVTKQLECRKMLLDQSVAFHNSAQQLGKKMTQVEEKCKTTTIAHDVETARRLLQQHQELKKGVLEASMNTLQEGQLLLERIRKMASCADTSNRHATTSACYGIEQQLLRLQDRKRKLEELWYQRRQQLTLCIQLLLVEQKAAEVLKWMDSEADPLLSNKDLGESTEGCMRLQDEFLHKFNACLDKYDEIQRLLGRADYLVSTALPQRAEVKSRLQTMLTRCGNIVTGYMARRVNLIQAYKFFALYDEAKSKLEDVEVLAMRTDRSGDELVQRHAQLYQNIIDSTVHPIYLGQVLVKRLGRENPSVKPILTKVTDLQERVTKLDGVCSAFHEDGKKRNEAVHQLECKYKKIYAWVTRVAQTRPEEELDVGKAQHTAQQFAIYNAEFATECKDKQMDAKNLLTAAENLAKSAADKKTAAEAQQSADGAAAENLAAARSAAAAADALLVKVKSLSEALDDLANVSEKKTKLNRTLIAYYTKTHQLYALMDLVEELIRVEKDPSHITEATVKHKEEVCKSLEPLSAEVERITKQFNEEVAEAKLEDNLEPAVLAVQSMAPYYSHRTKLLNQFYEHWKVFVTAGRDFNVQWKQFVVEARKTVDWVLKVEHDFFPKLAGELGTSLSDVKAHEKRLEDFKPTIRKVQEEIEKQLKQAELISLKGDTRGQRDQMINELLKVHTRFQARIGEYRFLLNMATKFFENLAQLDKLIETTEKEYKSEVMPKEVEACKKMLQEHELSRNKLVQYLDFSSEEADQIITRVRQQDSESDAREGVQKLLQMGEGKRKEWEDAWDDHKKRLEQNYLLSQFYFDLKKLQDELDELQHNLVSRHGNYGSSLSSVKMTSDAFRNFERAADEIEGKVKEFTRTADRMIKDRHYDSRRVKHEVDDTEKKWNTFYNTIKSYRMALDDSAKFFELMDGCEGWLTDAGQFLLGIGKRAPDCKTLEDVDKLIAEIEKYRLDGSKQQDDRLNKMEKIATDLYGQVGGPEKMQNILDKNHEMFNAFVKAIEDLAVLRNNLLKTEQIIAGMGADKGISTGPKQFRFIQPLENAEIVEGLSFTFECRLETDKPPTIEWLKDGEPVKGFRPSYKDGICRLDIDETMMKDCGKFVCKATIDTGSIETSATLKVKVASTKTSSPEFSKHLRAADVPEGTSHTLECIVTGTPFPTVSWFFNDKPIQNNQDYLMTIDNGRCLLKIRKMTKPLAGNYTCKISNPAGEVTTSASVNTVAVRKPEFTQPLTDQSLKEGRPARLECKFVGEPAPQIQWMYNDEPLFPSAVFRITVNDNSTSLDIQQVYPEDCGSYTVIAKNLGGESRTSCLLSLDTAPPPSTSRAPCKPEFIQPLQHIDAQEGTRARLECVCTGFPEPEVEWYHNDKLVKKGGKDFEISYDHGRCALLIQEVYLEDSGDYMCVAKNAHGSASTKCKLIVSPLSDFSDGAGGIAGEVPPKFTQLLKDIEGIEGELVIFECRVIGHPTPVIKWYRGRNQIQSSPEFQIKSERELQTLTIPKAYKEDAGNYMVKATNDAGVAKCYATLVVKEGERHGMKMRLVESSHTMPGVIQEGHQPPTITRAFHDFTVKQGKPCSMEVIIVSRPQAKVQWLFNNEPIITPDYKISAFGDTHILHIPSVMEEDAGRFSVVAENESGKAWCSALLVVVDEAQLLAGEGSPPETPQGGFFQPSYGPPPVVQKRPPRPTKADHTSRPKTPQGPPAPPQFMQQLRDVSGEEGQRVTLEAVVGGQPEPIVRWFKDGKALTGPVAVDYEFGHLPGGRVSLTIPSAKEIDSGRYTCMANSSLGEAQSTAELRVKGVSAAPQFLEKLQTTEVREGEPVRFRVRLSGRPTPQVKWFRGGQEIHSSPDFNITQHGDVHALYIPEVFYEDGGKFTVKAFSSAGEISCTADLIVEALSGGEDYGSRSGSRGPPMPVSSAPSFTKPLFNRAAEVGQRITLECTIPHPPQPEKIQWYHNGVELHPSPQHQMSYSNGLCTLTLARIQPDMRGRYVCSVTINNQRGATDMHLDVMAPAVPEAPDRRPEFEDKLKNVEASEGKDATFFCRVQAQPPPKIQWLHDGRPIHPSGRHEIKLGRDGSCYLRIRDVGPSDVGVYTCMATNNLGQGTSAAELRLQPSGSMVDETSYVDAAGLRRVGGRARGPIDRGVGGVAEQYYRPVFQKIPADITVSEGQMARFDSVVSGRPIPDMLWFRDGTQVFSDILHKIVINEEGINSLIFDATTMRDAGLYTCIAQNRAGEDRFQVRLNVSRRPVTSVPRFMSQMNNQTAYEGGSVTFSVQVEGIPTPKVGWQKDGRFIDQDPHYQISMEGNTSTLHISHVGPDDSGWYECTAASPAGTATHRARLNVQYDQDRAQSAARSTPQYGAPQRARTTTPVGRRPEGPPSAHQYQSSMDVYGGQAPSPYGFSGRQSRTETTVRTTTLGSSPRPRDSSNGPQLIEPMKDVQVNEGGSAHFGCRISSLTQPTSEWFFNNAPLYPSQKHQISTREGGMYTLDIRGVTPSDSGVYKCAVSNEAGEVTCIAHLRVGSSTPSMRAEHIGRERATPDYSSYDGGAGSRQQYGSRQGTPGGYGTPRGWDQGDQHLEEESRRMQAELSQASRSQPSMPRFVTLLNDVSVTPGSPARFEVTISGYPQPEVQWFKDGSLIQPSRDFQIQRNGDRYSLTITEAVAEDSGTITCRATNPSGTRDVSARLSVQGAGNAPKFIQPLTSQTAVDGSEVVMTCVVKGQPAPEVTWYHNDASLANSKDFIISYDPQSGRAKLVIADCMLDDAGMFKCVARNSSGQSETAASLTVVPDKKQGRISTPLEQSSGPVARTGPYDGTVEITGYGDPPKFMQPIQPCVVVEGQQCVFTAVVGGDPFPEISWLKEKQEFILTDRYRTTVNRDTGVCSLYINNCQMSDTGVYSCRASNAAGRATCTANVVIVPPNVEVTVTEKTTSVKKERVTMMGDQETRVVENSPTFTEALLPVIEVNEGEPIRLQCQVSAEPAPEIVWYFGGAPVTSSPRVNVSITTSYTTLNIASATLSDTGEYVCRANNNLGEAVTRTFLRVRKLERDMSSTRVSSAQSAGSRTMTPQGYGGHYPAGSAVEVAMPPGSYSGGPSGYRYSEENPPTPPPRVGSPKFTLPLRNQAVRDGEPVWFTVQFSGLPAPSVTWFANGNPVHVDEEFQIRTDMDKGESTLFIREVFPEDEGEFICKLDNPLGSAITNSHLFIVNPSTGKPLQPETSITEMVKSSKIYDLERNLSVDDKQSDSHISTLYANIKANQITAAHVDSVFVPIDKQRQLELVCGGVPPDSRRESHTSSLLAQIDSWTRVRSESAPPPQERFSETVSIDSSEEKAQTFEFRLLSERKKMKISRFNAFRQAQPKGVKMEAEILEGGDKISRLDLTRAGYAEAIASQRKEIHMQLQGSKPRFVTELKPLTVMDGSTAQFVCHVNGEPMPDKITWYHDDKMVPTSSPDVETKYDKKNGEISLTIGEVFPQDAGKYECVAANVYGKSSTRTHLTVDAYEYQPDSEESYTSQTESVTSRTSSRMRHSLQEASTGPTTFTEEFRLSKRENFENVELVEVKWQQKKYAESVEAETPLGITGEISGRDREMSASRVEPLTCQPDMDRVRRAPKTPCFAQITTSAQVKESSPLGDLRPAPQDSALPSQISSDNTNIRAVRSRSESRISSTVSTNTIERTSDLLEKVPLLTDSGSLLRQQSPTGNLVRPTVRRVGPTRVDAGFMRQELANVGELPSRASPEQTPKKEVAFEGCPGVRGERPASWSFTQYMERIHGMNEASQVGELRTSPKNFQRPQERMVENSLQHPAFSSAKRPTFVRPSTEFHSEGEEDDIFLEAAEPSLSSQPVGDSVVPTPAVKSRPYMRAVSQLDRSAPGVIGPGPVAFSPQGPPRLEQAASSAFVRVTKSTPPYKRAVIQNTDTSSFIAIVKEFHGDGSSSPKQGLMSVTSDLDKAAVNDRPANWSLRQYCLAALENFQPLQATGFGDSPVAERGNQLVQSPLRSSPPRRCSPPYSLVRPVVERHSPQAANPFSVDAGSLDSASRASAQEVARTQMMRPDRRRTASKVQEQNLGGPIAQFEFAQHTQVSQGMNQFVSPVLADRAELSGHATEPRPITRAVLSVGRATTDSTNAMGPFRTDDLSMNITSSAQASTELSGHRSMPRPITRALEGRAQQEELNAQEGGSGLNIDAMALSTQPSLEQREAPSSAAKLDRPLSRVGDMEDQGARGEEIASGSDEVDGSTRMNIPPVGVMAQPLERAQPANKVLTRASTMEKRISPDRLTDLASSRVDELSMTVSGSLETRDQYVASLTDRPVSRIDQVIDEVKVRDVTDTVMGRDQGLEMNLTGPQAIEESVIEGKVNIDKVLTKTQTLEHRISPERLTDLTSSKVDELSMNISGNLESRDQYVASLTDRPISRIDQVIDEVNVRDVTDTVVGRESGLEMNLKGPESVEQTLLERLSNVDKVVSRTQTLEKRISPDRLTDLSSSKVDDLSMTVSGSLETRDQYLASSIDRPISRIDQVIDQVNVSDVDESVVGRESGLEMNLTGPGSVEQTLLERLSNVDKVVSRTQTLEKRISPDRLSDLSSSKVDELSMTVSGSLETRDQYVASSIDRPVSRIDQVIDEVSVRDVTDTVVGREAGLEMNLTGPGSVEQTLLERLSSVDKVVSRTQTLEKRMSPERLTDLASSRVDDLSMSVNGNVTERDQYKASSIDRPISRVDQFIDEVNVRNVTEGVAGRDEGLEMNLTGSESAEPVILEKTSVSKMLTRTPIMERRISPEKISEVMTPAAPAGEAVQPVYEPRGLGPEDLERARVEDLVIHTRQEMEEQREIITESFSEEVEVVGKKDVEQGKPGHSEITIEQEIITQSIREEEERIPAPDDEPVFCAPAPPAEVPPPRPDDANKPGHSEITIEQEIITQSIREEEERIPVPDDEPVFCAPAPPAQVPPPRPDDAIKQTEITEERQIITETIYEEIDILDKKKDEQEMFEEWETTDGSGFVEEKAAPEEEKETKDQSEETFEQWVVEQAIEKETVQRASQPTFEKMPSPEKETRDESEETFEQWVVEEKVEQETTQQVQQFERRPSPEKVTYDEGQETFEQWVVEEKIETETKITQQVEKPTLEKPAEEPEMFEEWEVVDKIQTETRQEVEIPVARQEITEEKDITTYEEWEVVDKIQNIQEVEVEVPKKEDSDSESFFSEGEITEKITQYETIVEQETRHNQESSDDLGFHEIKKEKRERCKSTDSGESFFSETEVIEKVTQFETTIETETKQRTDDFGMLENRSVKALRGKEMVHESSIDLGIGAETKVRKPKSKDSDSESFFSENEVLEKYDATQTTVETTTTQKTAWALEGGPAPSLLEREITLAHASEAHLPLTRQTELSKETMFRELGTEGIRSAKPAFVRPLAPATGKDGAPITLSCQVAGWPRPEVKWFVDDVEIKLSVDFRMSYDTEGVCTLTILDVLPEDEGEYSVRATNQYGCSITEAYLTVKEGLEAKGGKGALFPLSHSSGDDEREALPSSGGEELYSSGGEETRTRWTLEQRQQHRGTGRRRGGGRVPLGGKDSQSGSVLTDDDERRRLEEWEEGFTLRTGLYDSSPYSEGGRAPVFSKQLDSKDVYETTPVRLECAVKGSPEPEIKWFQDGVQISNQDSHKKLAYSKAEGLCSLSIDHVTLQDEAEYVCQASNRNGVATTWGELLVEKLIEGMEQLVMEEYQELEVEMEFKWKQPKKNNQEASEGEPKTPAKI